MTEFVEICPNAGRMAHRVWGGGWLRWWLVVAQEVVGVEGYQTAGTPSVQDGVFSHGLNPGSGDVPDKQPVCP